MAMRCNIDAKGKRIRLVNGIVFLLVGLGLTIWWAWPGGGVLAWMVSVILIVAGAFAVFEARAGWCALRALGFRTPV